MAQYIDKDALVAEIERLKNEYLKHSRNKFHTKWACGVLDNILSFIETLEVKEVDLDLITEWFDHIAQIADDRMTLTNQRMTDAYALKEIKRLAKDNSWFITRHYKAQEGE